MRPDVLSLLFLSLRLHRHGLYFFADVLVIHGLTETIPFRFLAALAALYLTLVSESVSESVSQSVTTTFEFRHKE